MPHHVIARLSFHRHFFTVLRIVAPLLASVVVAAPLWVRGADESSRDPEKSKPSVAPARPVLGKESRLIAPAPDLMPHGLQPAEGTPGREINHPNDHTVFQARDGTWHIWTCVRHTNVGRVLCHWETDDFFSAPWRLRRDVIRADRTAGESRVDYKGQEFIQSPVVVLHEGRYYMLYGGYATGLDAAGRPTGNYDRMENQLSLMTSPDGRNWTRHRNVQGFSRVFAGPGAVRDPCVVKFGDTWFCYYAGHHDADRDNVAIYVRTSPDLVNWSEWRIVHKDTNIAGLIPSQSHESPFVVERDGYYYLFRTLGRHKGVLVFRSRDPFDFGTGDMRDRAITHLPLMAPEIVTGPDGQDYITSILDETGFHIRIFSLRWEAM
jgi:hypothetical protein